jgi:hypothetical protein
VSWGEGDGALGVIGEVVQAAGVGEQGAQRQTPAVVARAAHQTRKVSVPGVGQGQPVLGGELQHHGRDERLGDAARAEVVVAGDAVAGAGEACAGGFTGQQRGGGSLAAGDQKGEQTAQGAGGARCRGGGGGV